MIMQYDGIKFNSRLMQVESAKVNEKNSYLTVCRTTSNKKKTTAAATKITRSTAT